MSSNDVRWSTFWSRGSSRSSAPSASVLYTGVQVAEDIDQSRVSEEVGFIVIEQGAGFADDGIQYEVITGSDSVKDLTKSPIKYNLTHGFSSLPMVGVVSMSGMDGGTGSWAILRGLNALEQTTITTVVDEDQVKDNERRHTTE